jgi:hypothetical protein
MRTAHDGSVTIVGGFRTAGGRTVRHGVRFAYTPTRTGVAVSVRVRPDDVIDVADFRAASAPPFPVRLRVRAPRTRELHSVPLVRSGYASATLGRVVRVGARVRVARAGTLTWLPR